jgi:hypothetical protein
MKIKSKRNCLAHWPLDDKIGFGYPCILHLQYRKLSKKIGVLNADVVYSRLRSNLGIKIPAHKHITPIRNVQLKECNKLARLPNPNILIRDLIAIFFLKFAQRKWKSNRNNPSPILQMNPTSPIITPI